MSYYVYLIATIKKNKIITNEGYTNDLKKKLANYLTESIRESLGIIILSINKNKLLIGAMNPNYSKVLELINKIESEIEIKVTTKQISSDEWEQKNINSNLLNLQSISNIELTNKDNINSSEELSESDNDKFDLMVVIDGPNYKKETSSVTSSATENEITLIGSVTMTLKDKNGNLLIEDKEITVSKDYKFSSSSINSSESEETIVRGDIEKYIEIQVINAVRSKL